MSWRTSNLPRTIASWCILIVLFFALFIEWRSNRGYRTTLRALEEALPHAAATIPREELERHLSGWFSRSERNFSGTPYVCYRWPSLLNDYRLWLVMIPDLERVGGLISGDLPGLIGQTEPQMSSATENGSHTAAEKAKATSPTPTAVPPRRDPPGTVLPEAVQTAFQKAYADVYRTGPPEIDFKTTLQSVAALLPTLKVSNRPDRADWNHVQVGANPVRFVAFRFSSTLDVPADLYWMFTFKDSTINWFILPVQGEMQGFDDYDYVRHGRFQDPAVPVYTEMRFQSLTGGRILPGQDYIIWFAIKATQLEKLLAEQEKLNEKQFDAGRQQRIQDLTKEVERERQVGVPLEIALRLVPSTDPVARGAMQIADRVGEPLYMTPGGKVLYNGGQALSSLAVSPDGRFLYATDRTESIHVVERASGAVQPDLAGDQNYSRVAMSPDGKRLAAASWPSMRVALWDLEKLTRLPDITFEWPPGVREKMSRVPGGFQEAALGAQFLGGSNELYIHLDGATSRSSPHWYDAVLWNIDERREVRRHSFDETAIGAEPTPDGRLLLYTRTEDGKSPDGMPVRKVAIGRLDWTTGETGPATPLDDGSVIYRKSIAPNGTMLALVIGSNSGHEVQVRDVATGEIRLRFSTLVSGSTFGTFDVNAFAWSPDSRLIAVGLSDASIRLWNIAENRVCAAWRGHVSTLGDVAFTQDGLSVVSCGSDGTIRQWNSLVPLKTVMTDSLGIRLVLLPLGEFSMGTPDRGTESLNAEVSDEQPAHRVRLTRPFLIGMHEVTVGQFRQFVDATGYQTTAEKGGRGGSHFVESAAWVERPEFTWRTPGFTQDEDHPVVQVSWHDATAFCQWLSTKENAKYRLPTEAEWEYASRAGNESYYTNDRILPDVPYGVSLRGNVSDLSILETIKNYPIGIAHNDGFPWTAPVGRLHLNDFGLYDMSGNVFEWCSDYYDAGWYRDSPIEDPVGPPRGVLRVQRGGGFSHRIWDTRCANRDYGPPDQTQSSLGFRVVRELAGEQGTDAP